MAPILPQEREIDSSLSRRPANCLMTITAG